MNEDAFLGFRTLITGTVIKAIYVIGCLVLTVAGTLWVMAAFLAPFSESASSAAIHVVGGVLTMTLGNLLWRLVCEGWILFFSPHEMLGSVEKTLKANTDLLETVSCQLAGIETNTEQRHQETMR